MRKWVFMTRKFTDFLIERYDFSPLEGIKLKYAIDLFLNESSKWLLGLILFYGLNQVTFYFVMSLSLLMIKPITGGLHFSTYLKCLVFTITFMLTAFFLYTQITLKPTGYLLLTLTDAMIMFLVAPVIPKAKDIFPDLKLRRRNIAVGFVLLHLLYFVSGQSHLWIISLWTFTLHALLLFYARRKINV